MERQIHQCEDPKARGESGSDIPRYAIMPFRGDTSLKGISPEALVHNMESQL